MEKLSELEDRPHRNNFQIDSIPETCETWESCEEELMKIIKSKLDTLMISKQIAVNE